MARASMTLKLEGVAAVQDVIAELRADRDRARTIAVALEQENAELERENQRLARREDEIYRANIASRRSLCEQLHRITAERDKLRTALTTVLDILGDPADDEACELRCLGPKVIAAAQEAL